MVKLVAGILILLSSVANAKVNVYEKDFSNRLIVYIDSDLKEDPKLYTETKRLLRESLSTLEKTLPPQLFKAVDKSRLKIVVLSENKSTIGRMSFIPFNRSYWSRKFEKLLDGSIVIHSPKSFVEDSKTGLRDLIHELAHFYHYDTLGYSNESILYSFNQAKQKGIYEGEYAECGHTEYFAELSAMFFTKEEGFESFDPSGYQLMSYLWNEKKSK